MRLRLTLIGLCWAPALIAQTPDPSFFKGDPQKIMLFCAEQAQNLDPHKGLVLARAGRAHLAAGDTAGAKALFLVTLGGHSDTQRRVGQAWLEAGDLPRAMEAFGRISSMESDAKNELTEAAVLLVGNGHPKEAASVMGRAYDLAPGDWQNANAFARACLRSQRPDLAAEWFAKGVVKNRKDEDFWIDVAHALANHGVEE